MTTLETSDDGGLHLPPELIGEARPHVTYDFEVFGEIMLIRPAERRSPFWKSATPRQRADTFRGWAGAVRPPVADLPDDTFRRENLYD